MKSESGFSFAIASQPFENGSQDPIMFLQRRVLNGIKDVSIWMVGKVSPSRAEVKVVSLFKPKPE